MTDSVSQRYATLASAAHARCAAREPSGTTRIQVGSATCENAAGAQEVWAELTRHIAASGRSDILLHQTGCTGRCSCEPIVNVTLPGQMPVKYERVDRDLVHRIFTSHVQAGQPVFGHLLDNPTQGLLKYELLFCSGARCRRDAELDLNLKTELERQLSERGIDAGKVRTGYAACFGTCREGRTDVTHVLVRPGRTLYRLETVEDVREVVEKHVIGGQVVERLRTTDEPLGQRFFDLYGDVAFFRRQSRIALRNSGIIDPESLDEYLGVEGFRALAKVLEADDPAAVIREISEARLRGRGGGGYPTGQKWAMAASQPETTRYLICNADEGDPGAFMDRSMLEGDPFSVIEGMAIAAFAIGASRGYVYVRAEYPMAIRRVQTAIDRCREAGLLGEKIFGSRFSFDVEIRLGAGAFVCGEETALIHSIEGERGQPRPRPPYPTTAGLWGKPTVINNVETFANVPVVMGYGASWFGKIGTQNSGGTKVFALAGKVRHTGLVEVPMGATLRDIVCEIGGGALAGRRLKAIQTGGPAGGCIPEKWLDTAVDFDTLTRAGSIMGSGGMIVMDDDDCMVDIAKFFMTFSKDESCGKCTPCREGTLRMLEILDRITAGKGVLQDLERLERLGKLMRKASLCGLGRAAPNPVLSTLTHFRDEYEAHVVSKSCPAKRCPALIRYEIDTAECIGCTVCARNCPAVCITGATKKPHVIDQERCIRCGRCFQVCRFNAVKRS